jgi:hypothetical protein
MVKGINSVTCPMFASIVVCADNQQRQIDEKEAGTSDLLSTLRLFKLISTLPLPARPFGLPLPNASDGLEFLHIYNRDAAIP